MDVRFNELSVGGKSSYDFDVFISGAGSYDSPARVYKRVEVPGRDGDLLLDKQRYENVDVKYKCISHGGITGFEEMRSFLSSLIGYQRIEDSFHPDEYRLGYLSGGVEPKIKGIDYDVASFELIFNCKPQRFLKDGENAITIQNGIIFNETLFKSRPLIRVYNAGTYTVNGTSFTISSVSGYSDIDCDIMDVSKGTINKNSTFTGDFPVLSPGENVVSGNYAIDIIPRWYTI